MRRLSGWQQAGQWLSESAKAAYQGFSEALLEDVAIEETHVIHQDAQGKIEKISVMLTPEMIIDKPMNFRKVEQSERQSLPTQSNQVNHIVNPKSKVDPTKFISLDLKMESSLMRLENARFQIPNAMNTPEISDFPQELELDSSYLQGTGNLYFPSHSIAGILSNYALMIVVMFTLLKWCQIVMRQMSAPTNRKEDAIENKTEHDECMSVDVNEKEENFRVDDIYSPEHEVSQHESPTVNQQLSRKALFLPIVMPSTLNWNPMRLNNPSGITSPPTNSKKLICVSTTPRSISKVEIPWKKSHSEGRRERDINSSKSNNQRIVFPAMRSSTSLIDSQYRNNSDQTKVKFSDVHSSSKLQNSTITCISGKRKAVVKIVEDIEAYIDAAGSNLQSECSLLPTTPVHLKSALRQSTPSNRPAADIFKHSAINASEEQQMTPVDRWNDSVLQLNNPLSAISPHHTVLKLLREQRTKRLRVTNEGFNVGNAKKLVIAPINDNSNAKPKPNSWEEEIAYGWSDVPLHRSIAATVFPPCYHPATTDFNDTAHLWAKKKGAKTWVQIGNESDGASAPVSSNPMMISNLKPPHIVSDTAIEKHKENMEEIDALFNSCQVSVIESADDNDGHNLDDNNIDISANYSEVATPINLNKQGALEAEAEGATSQANSARISPDCHTNPPLQPIFTSTPRSNAVPLTYNVKGMHSITKVTVGTPYNDEQHPHYEKSSGLVTEKMLENIAPSEVMKKMKVSRGHKKGKLEVKKQQTSEIAHSQGTSQITKPARVETRQLVSWEQARNLR